MKIIAVSKHPTKDVILTYFSFYPFLTVEIDAFYAYALLESPMRIKPKDLLTLFQNRHILKGNARLKLRSL